MVRVPEGPLRPTLQWRVTGHRADRGNLQGFLFGQRRQQAGQAARQQGFAGTGRPAQQQVMAAGGGHQQGAFGGDLALHLGKVRIRRGMTQQAPSLVGGQWRLAVQVCDQLQQVSDRQHRQPGGQAGFFGVFLGHHQGTARLPGSQCSGQHALDGAYGAGQGELAEAFEWDQGISRYLGAGSQNAKGDRQVEAAAVLWQVGRCQIQGLLKCSLYS